MNKKIIIKLSENDLSDLLSGDIFDWSFPTEDGEQTIDVQLFNEDIHYDK